MRKGGSPVNPMHFREGTTCLSLSGIMIGGVRGMHNMIVKHYWLLVALILRVPLACDYYHRVLVAEQGGEHIDDSLS